MIAVCMVDVDLVLHGEEQPAICAPSALMLEECPSGCLQPDIFSSSCAPVAPVAVIRTHAFTERDVSCDRGVALSPQRLGLPLDSAVFALAVWCAVVLHHPVGTFPGVLPLCPAVYRVPEQVVQPLERV